jgi:hypothetical protein
VLICGESSFPSLCFDPGKAARAQKMDNHSLSIAELLFEHIEVN